MQSFLYRSACLMVLVAVVVAEAGVKKDFKDEYLEFNVV
jgi:hypothetical protein